MSLLGQEVRRFLDKRPDIADMGWSLSPILYVRHSFWPQTTRLQQQYTIFLGPCIYTCIYSCTITYQYLYEHT